MNRELDHRHAPSFHESLASALGPSPLTQCGKEKSAS
jgi:hypothetical protein